MWDQDRFFVTLRGAPSNPLSRLAWVPARDKSYLWKEDDGSPRPRSIEVWPGKKELYVMTRLADEITNAIADGFAQLAARTWVGDRET